MTGATWAGNEGGKGFGAIALGVCLLAACSSSSSGAGNNAGADEEDSVTADFVASGTTGGLPLVVSFTDRSIGEIDGRLWSFGDGATSSERNPEHTYVTAGPHTVSLAVVGPGGVATAMKDDLVVVQAGDDMPVAEFAASRRTGVAPLDVDFTDLSVGEATSRVWSFGDGSFSLEAAPSHTYEQPGTYSVRLTVLGASGADVETKLAWISVTSGTPDLEVDFDIGTRVGVAPLNVAFTDMTTGPVERWRWDFGEGAIVESRNATHTYTAPGVYTVRLTVLGLSGEIASEVKREVISVGAAAIPPEARITSGPASGTSPLTVAFQDGSHGQIQAREWNFGDGTSSSLANPVHTYDVPGVYDVSLRVTGPNGTNTETLLRAVRVDEVGERPVAAFLSTIPAGTAPHEVFFTDASAGLVDTYRWEFGDGTISNERNPVHVYQLPGSYNLSLRVQGPGGIDLEERLGFIVVGGSVAPPTAGFSSTATRGGCPLNVGFSDESSSDVTSWLWSFGDGATSTQRDPVHVYDEPGTYSVALAVSGPGGVGGTSEPGWITVDEIGSTLAADFVGAPRAGQAPLSVSFDDRSSGNVETWFWRFGDGTTSTAQHPTHVYSTAGTYTVDLFVGSGDDIDWTSQAGYVTVQASPEPPTAHFVASPRTGPAPLTVDFMDQSVGDIAIRFWDFGDGTTSLGHNPSHEYTNEGDYTVTLWVSGPDGIDSQTLFDWIRVEDDATTCEAGNARENTGALKTGYDFIPFDELETEGCYVVYSALRRSDGQPGIQNTVGIFLFELEGGELLVFGAGYGDPFGSGGALFDAATDVANVSAVVEDCMGLSRVGLPVHVLVPHGHGDHINPAFVREMRAAGYAIEEIRYHSMDSNILEPMSNWTQQDRNQFVPMIGGFSCHEELVSYPSPLGKLWFTRRAGHTGGSMDLVVDFHDDPDDRRVVLGSMPGGECTVPPGTTLWIRAHGTVTMP